MEEQETTPSKELPSKKWVAALYVPLIIPALVPLYMVRDQEDPVIVAIMLGTTVAVLFANAAFLVLVYRWFAGRTDDV